MGDGRLCRFCLFSQRDHGLSALSGDGPSGRSSPSAGAVCGCGAAGRRVCRGGVFAGIPLSGLLDGEAGGWRGDGGDRLWRGSASAAVDAAVFCSFLRAGRDGAGTEPAFKQRSAAGQWDLLHRCRSSSSDIVCGGGVSSGARGVSGGSPPRTAGGISAGAGLHRRTDGRALRPVGQRQSAAGAGQRTAGSGGGARKSGRHSAAVCFAPADGGTSPGSGRAAGAAAGGGSGAASRTDSLPCGRNAGGTAAGNSHRICGDLRRLYTGDSGSAVAHGIGAGLFCCWGRGDQKGRSA